MYILNKLVQYSRDSRQNPKHGHFRSILIQDGWHFKKFKYANLLVFAFSCVIMNTTLFQTIMSKTKLTNNLPTEMAHSFLTIFDDYSVCWVNSIPVENWLNSSKNNNLIIRKTNQNMVGRFLLQDQMKTSLEVINMNATYKVISQHIVDFQRNAIPL